MVAQNFQYSLIHPIAVFQFLIRQQFILKQRLISHYQMTETTLDQLFPELNKIQRRKMDSTDYCSREGGIVLYTRKIVEVPEAEGVDKRRLAVPGVVCRA